MKELNRFREIFWDAFHVPALETDKFNHKFQELEKINDILAGPLYSIYEQGNCNYVFSDQKRFEEIKSADDFLDWMSELVKEYADEVTALKPENESEQNDQKVLLYQTDLKMELVELSYQLIANQNKDS